MTDTAALAPDTADAMLATRFARKGDFVSRSIAGETILVPVRNRTGDLDSIYNLSDVASSIWERIDGQAPVREIVDGVCAEFDVGRETAESDALEFIASLQAAGLIETSAVAGSD